MTSPSAFEFVFHGAPVHIPGSALHSGLLLNPDDDSSKSVTVKRRDVTVTFDMSPDERPYADGNSKGNGKGDEDGPQGRRKSGKVVLNESYL